MVMASDMKGWPPLFSTWYIDDTNAFGLQLAYEPMVFDSIEL
jgi:hypothetical protein